MCVDHLPLLDILVPIDELMLVHGISVVDSDGPGQHVCEVEPVTQHPQYRVLRHVLDDVRPDGRLQVALPANDG